jgi:hypothetical protein
MRAVGSRRRLIMAIALGAIGFGIAVSVSALAKPARKGKVVRIERRRLSARDALRACLYTSGQGEKFTCFGVVEPGVGDTYAVLDGNGYRGRARATKVEIGEYDNCKIGVSHEVSFEYEEKAGGSSSPTQPQYWGTGLALRGVEVESAKAKVITDHSNIRSPSGKDETVWMAIDLNGDNQADMISTWYDGCDNASMRPTPPANRTLKPLCLDYWLREDGEWERKTTDPDYLCM